MVEQTAAMAGSRGIAVGSEEYIKLLTAMLRLQSQKLPSEGMWLPLDQQEAVVQKYSSAIVDAISGILGTFNDEGLVKEAVRFSMAVLFSDSFSPQSSGIVIAGYGTDEYFPTVLDYETDGYVGRRIKIKRKDISDVSRGMPSCIRSFAQGDMVQRFMNGIDLDFLETIMRTFTDTLSDSCFAVLDKYGVAKHKKADEVKEQIKEAVNKASEAIFGDAEKYMARNFSDPVVKMVALLPKDEIAHLAESLVALTSLKRRVSSDAETVGGPIDVALISKGDGFVWIKRKNYFSGELNHQFTRRYMDDLTDGATNDGKQGAASQRRPAPTGPRRGAAEGGGKSPTKKNSDQP